MGISSINMKRGEKAKGHLSASRSQVRPPPRRPSGYETPSFETHETIDENTSTIFSVSYDAMNEGIGKRAKTVHWPRGASKNLWTAKIKKTQTLSWRCLSAPKKADSTCLLILYSHECLGTEDYIFEKQWRDQRYSLKAVHCISFARTSFIFHSSPKAQLSMKRIQMQMDCREYVHET